MYPPMRMEMETDRLVLRPWTAPDAQWPNELYRERQLGRGEEPRGLAATERIVNRIIEQAAATGISLLPVVRKADGLAIGYCGLIERRTSIDEPEIAYELLREHHGHGYATEAARAVVAAATDTGRCAYGRRWGRGTSRRFASSRSSGS